MEHGGLYTDMSLLSPSNGVKSLNGAHCNVFRFHDDCMISFYQPFLINFLLGPTRLTKPITIAAAVCMVLFNCCTGECPAECILLSTVLQLD